MYFPGYPTLGKLQVNGMLMSKDYIARSATELMLSNKDGA